MKKKKARILKCDCYTKYENEIVEIYHHFSNGIDFVTRYGLVFIPDGDYEIIEESSDNK